MSVSATNEYYYVYVYLDPRKPGKYKYNEYNFNYEPFYVGKGIDNRFTDHLKEWHQNRDSNLYKNRKIKKIKNDLGIEPIIIKYKNYLSEKESLVLEMKMILSIGRINLKNGPLTNLTNGGEGNSGWIPSNEYKKNMSKLLSGKNNPMFGKKGKLSPAFGKRESQSAKLKNSLAHIKNNNPANKYNYKCSDGKDYWNDFNKYERQGICHKFRRKNIDIIKYKDVIIERSLK